LSCERFLNWISLQNRFPRALGWLAVGVVLGWTAGCGSESDRVAVAGPQTITVGTAELDGRAGIGFRLDLRELQITPGGWRVEASVTNATQTRWTIGSPHARGGTKFGLFVGSSPEQLQAGQLEASNRTTPALIAKEFAPPLPRVFAPRASWSGSFAGTGHIPAGSFVSVAFGRFSADSAPSGFPARLMAISSPIAVTN
jgi:hypothetical protein